MGADRFILYYIFENGLVSRKYKDLLQPSNNKNNPSKNEEVY
jgi:hypothetical protein